MIPAPPPGIHRNVPAEVYHTWNAFSNSQASKLEVSPKCLLDYRVNGPDEETRAKAVGTAGHGIMLDGSFDSRCYVAQQCECITQKGGRCTKLGTLYAGGFFCGTHREDSDVPVAKLRLTPEEYDLCQTLHRAVSQHRFASTLLAKANPDTTEVSLVWECSVTGVLCKARADLLVPELVMADLKLMRSCNRHAFEKANFEMGYYRQAWHYLDGAQTLGIEVPGFVNIVAEKQRPYDVACYWQSKEALHYGGIQMVNLRARYRDCLKRNEWPGCAEDIIEIGIPQWAKAQLEREAA